MKERIFFISPLPEDEEEEKLPYDEHGNTTVMAYYDKHGQTIENDYQEQPEEEPITENRIIIIYEAPRPKVITQQNNTQENNPAILTSQEILTTSPHPQPETYKDRARDTRYNAYRPLYKYIYGEPTPNEQPGTPDTYSDYGYLNKYINREQPSNNPQLNKVNLHQ